MTTETAWEIIRACEGWNTSQTSVSLAFHRIRTAEDDVLDARRSALAEAWRTVGGTDSPSGAPVLVVDFSRSTPATAVAVSTYTVRAHSPAGTPHE